MKESLLKKRYGIPVALLLVLLLSGTALAWYVINTISSVTTVQEPLSTTEQSELSSGMYPGENNTWCFDIVNSAVVPYTVKADLTFNAPYGVSIHIFKVKHDGETYIDMTDDLTQDNHVEFEILGKETTTCVTQIIAADNAISGPVTVSFNLSR